MKKRFFPLAMAVCLLCCLAVTSCSAAVTIADGVDATESMVPTAEPQSTAVFTDVPDDAWYAKAVDYCHGRGLIDGTSPSTFSPGEPASRGVLVTALYRQAGAPAVQRESGFIDVPPAYRDAAAWAAERGIAVGYGDGCFGGEDPVTREQFAVMLWRAEGQPAASAAGAFADQAEISDYAAEAAAWAQHAGIVKGREDNRFDPKANITRGEFAVMLFRWTSDTRPAGDPPVELLIGDQTFLVSLEDSPAVRSFLALLPLRTTMQELNGNEKYCTLPERLPTNAAKPGTIEAGDLMLYGSDCLVLFYESFSSAYSYTRLGRLEDPSGLAQAVGRGGIEVTIRLAETEQRLDRFFVEK